MYYCRTGIFCCRHLTLVVKKVSRVDLVYERQRSAQELAQEQQELSERVRRSSRSTLEGLVVVDRATKRISFRHIHRIQSEQGAGTRCGKMRAVMARSCLWIRAMVSLVQRLASCHGEVIRSLERRDVARSAPTAQTWLVHSRHPWCGSGWRHPALGIANWTAPANRGLHFWAGPHGETCSSRTLHVCRWCQPVLSQESLWKSDE